MDALSTSGPTFLPTAQPTTPRPTPKPTPAPSVTPGNPTAMPVPAPTLESCEKVRERTGPPPNVLSARFTSTGENILVDLDAASDQAGKLAGEYFPCTALLDFADVDTAECVWVDATQISAEVNNALNFVPGETVTLRAQTTMLACDDDRCECRVLNDASSVVADPPDLPGVQPVFQAPDAIAVCEEGGLTVDASLSTGSGGRDWTRLVWSVNATGPPESRAAAKVNGTWDNATEALESMRHRAATDLSSEFTAETTELQALAKGGFDTLVLSLELENFLGSTKTESVEMKLSTKSIPSVLIVGGANQVAKVGNALTVEASGLASGCDGRSLAQRAVDYAWNLYRLDGVDDPEEDWTQLAEGAEFVNVAADERYFQLDPFSLDSGTTYVARAEATDAKYDLSNTADVYLAVGVGSVVAAIEGGDRVVSVQDELQLDASSSFDEDINPDCGDGAGDWRANIGRRRLAHNDKHEARAAGDCGTGDDAGLSFSWICEELEVLDDGEKQVSGSCATDTEPFPTGVWALKSDKQRLIFLGTWLGTGNYRFTVTAASADARNSTTSVDIELINEEPSKVVVSNFARKVNAAEKQTILGLVTPPDGVTIDDLTTTWTLAEGDLEAGQTLREVAKTRVELQGADLASGQRYHDLVLSLGAMVPGGTYKFLLTATLTSETGDTTEGYASVSVSASALPSAGVVVASPRKGSELETPFELVASYWVGDELPLKYGYETGDAVLRRPTADPKLSDVRLSLPLATTSEPGDDYGDDYYPYFTNVTFYVVVVDQVGATT